VRSVVQLQKVRGQLESGLDGLILLMRESKLEVNFSLRVLWSSNSFLRLGLYLTTVCSLDLSNVEATLKASREVKSIDAHIRSEVCFSFYVFVL
jgi:hypothetical protein